MLRFSYVIVWFVVMKVCVLFGEVAMVCVLLGIWIWLMIALVWVLISVVCELLVVIITMWVLVVEVDSSVRVTVSRRCTLVLNS